MLNNIEKQIIKDIKQFEECDCYKDIKTNILNLSKDEKEEYITELATAYNCTTKEAKRSINYFAYDIEQEFKEATNNE